MLKLINKIIDAYCYSFNSLLTFVGNRVSGINICTMLSIPFRFLENFLLVMLCKYDLGTYRFIMAKWFFCTLFCVCCIDVSLSTGDIMDLLFNYLNLTSDPSTVNNLDVLTHGTNNIVCSADTMPDYISNKPPESLSNNTDTTQKNVEPIVATKNYYITICAVAILYWGFCISASGW